MTVQPKPRVTQAPPLMGTGSLAIGMAILLTISLMIPVPIKGRGVSAGMDLIHAPSFALLTWLVCGGLASANMGRWLPQSLLGKLVYVALPLALCGGMVELAQGFIGRGSSWHDARANLWGSLAGACWFHASSERIPLRSKWTLWLAIVGLFALASTSPLLAIADLIRWQRAFPLIASFETEREVRRFFPQEARFTRVRSFATEGDWALQIQLQTGQYPGIYLDGLPGNWGAYEFLRFDLHLDEGDPLDLIVKVYDAAHPDNGFDPDDRFDGHLKITPGTHTIRVPLSEILSAPATRLMDLNKIQGWQLFTYDLTEPRTIVLDNLRLE